MAHKLAPSLYSLYSVVFAGEAWCVNLRLCFSRSVFVVIDRITGLCHFSALGGALRKSISLTEDP